MDNNIRLINEYKSIIDGSPDIIARFDNEKRYVFINKTALEEFNVSEDDVIGKTNPELKIPGSIIRILDDALDTVFSTKSLQEADIEFNTAEGKKYYHTIFTPDLNNKNEVQTVLAAARNITERKIIEKENIKLIESMKLYSDTFEYALNGYCIHKMLYDRDLRRYDCEYIKINPAFEKHTGLSADNIIGKTIRQIYPDNEADEVIKLYADVLLSDIPAQKEIFFKPLKEWYELSIFPMKHDNFTVIVQNITVRKSAEEVLKNYNYELKRSQEVANVGSWVWHISSNKVEWSDQMYKIFGIDKDNFPGVLNDIISKAIHPDDRAEVERSNKSVLTEKKPIPLEYRVIRPDGTIRTVWAEAAELELDDNGNPGLLRGVVKDITEYKQTEEKLKNSEEKLNSILNNMADIVWSISYPDFKPLYVSSSIENIYGYSADQFFNDPMFWKNIVYPDDRRDIEDIISELVEKGYTSIERRIIKSDGEIIWTIDKAVLIKDVNNIPVRIDGIVTDISYRKKSETEREKLQMQLYQAQKMESIGQLAGGVAHDFNNMLGVIMGHTELAMEQIDQNHLLFTDLKEIKKAASRSADLTRQLLSFARKQTILPVVINLNNTIDNMLNMLNRLISEDISLKWIPGENLWNINADPSQIDQIITNLCVNSRDAISGSGNITIKTDNAALTSDFFNKNPECPAGEYCMLTISDDGCGIDKEIHGKIFDPFFTTKDQGKGTGLGLATVYGIVKQNNGYIDLISEPGKGSAFTIYFPRYMGKSEAENNGKLKETNLRGNETIFLVEDEISLLNMAKTVLESYGYNIISASEADEALRLGKLHCREVDLFITDLIMPVMNGLELIANITSACQCSNRKHLIMSGYTADIISNYGVLDNGVGFIQKPFAIKDLVAKVRNILDS